MTASDTRASQAVPCAAHCARKASFHCVQFCRHRVGRFGGRRVEPDEPHAFAVAVIEFFGVRLEFVPFGRFEQRRDRLRQIRVVGQYDAGRHDLFGDTKAGASVAGLRVPLMPQVSTLFGLRHPALSLRVRAFSSDTLAGVFIPP